MSSESFLLGIGGFVFRVRPIYSYVQHVCKDYVLCDSPKEDFDFEIMISDYEIDAEIKHSSYDFSEVIMKQKDRLFAYYESVALFRKIAEFLPLHGAAVFHGVLLELNGEGYLFTAKSGTGKTTHAQNWLKAFPDARIVNGDKPILRIEHHRLMGYGTPWCGKEHYQINKKIPIKAVIWLKRGEKNEIEEISAPEMMPKWVSQSYRPDNKSLAMRVIDTSIKMMDHVKLYSLHCNMDIESAFVAYSGMNQE